MDREFMVWELDGSPKYCTTCRIYRPESTSHCHEKGRCIAKYDHYCPMLSSPIGIGNYKHYLNFVLHTELLVSYLFAMGIVTVIKIERNGWTITLLVLSAVMLVFVTSLLSLHVHLSLNNITTRENAFCRGRTSEHSRLSPRERQSSPYHMSRRFILAKLSALSWDS